FSTNSVLEGKSFQTPVIQVTQPLQSLLTELVENETPHIFCTKALIYLAFSQLLQIGRLISVNSPLDDTFRKAVLYIMEHYKENLTLKRVSTAVGVTPVHLSRMFGQKTDFCFTELVNIVRLQEACYLLQNSTLSVSNIAFEAGFGSIRNFNRIFEKFFHSTPKQFRVGEFSSG
ncbi:MAG: helix-turn-helix transcriptional regulator, partial [Ruminococcaceae bacterium]|nr:helix-turn-helix transcriptional regulator [Oscillospiraceae bacterium]